MSETIPAPVTAASTIKSDSLLTRLTKVFDHNRYGIIAMAAASILIVSACVESQTASPTTGQPVTRNALNEQALDFNVEHERKVGALKSEMEKLTEDARVLEIKAQNTYDSFISAYEDLDEQDARKAKLLEFINTTIPGLLGPYSTFATSLLATGFFADNKRKDRKIKELRKQS